MIFICPHSPWGGGSLLWLQRERVIKEQGNSTQEEQAGDDLIEDPEQGHAPSVHAMHGLHDGALHAVQVPGVATCNIVWYPQWTWSVFKARHVTFVHTMLMLVLQTVQAIKCIPYSMQAKTIAL